MKNKNIVVLSAVDNQSNNQYGGTVSLSGDSEWLAIGDNVIVENNCKIYIYQKSGKVYLEESTITEDVEGLGYRLSFNEDGTKLVAGSVMIPLESKIDRKGKVFTYKLVDGIPTKINELNIDSEHYMSRWSTCPSISKDGLVLAVGLPDTEVGGLSNVGKVNIYDWNNDTNSWDFRVSIHSLNSQELNYFGITTSLNEDGSIIAIGEGVTYNHTGQVSIYTYNSDINNYELKLVIKADNLINGDLFVYSSLSAKGDIIAIGAPNKDNSVNKAVGKVYVYQIDFDNNTFSDINILEPDNEDDVEWFGRSVSLSSNATSIAVSCVKPQQELDFYNGQVSILSLE